MANDPNRQQQHHTSATTSVSFSFLCLSSKRVGGHHCAMHDPSEDYEAPSLREPSFADLPPQAPLYIYHLVASKPLPRIRLNYALRDLLLPRVWTRRLQRFLFTYRREIVFMHILGQPMTAAAFLVPKIMGEWLAIIGTIIDIPAVLGVVLALRVDLLKALLSTYDFWFYSVINIITATAMCFYLPDRRLTMLPMSFLKMETHAVMDANSRHTLHGDFFFLFSYVVTLTLLLVPLGLELVDGCVDHVLISSFKHALSIRDVMLNGLVTMSVLVLRNLYRRRYAKIDPKSDDYRGSSRCLDQIMAAAAMNAAVGATHQIVACISFHCAIKYTRVPHSMEHETPVLPFFFSQNASVLTARVRSDRTQTFHVQLDQEFDASCNLGATRRWRSIVRILGGRRFWYQQPLTKPQQRLLHSIGGLGYALFCLLCIFAKRGPRCIHRIRWQLTILAMLSSLVYILVLMMHYQQLLVKRLIWSFDFVFMSVQLTLLHLCICDFFDWETQMCCGGILLSWIWMHFLLTLDALPPIAKQNLGFKHRFVCLGGGIVTFLVLQLMLSAELLSWNAWELQDRTMEMTLHWPHTHTVEFSVVAFYLNRCFTVFAGCLRILWRISRLTKSRSDELVVLQGKVAYEYVCQQSRKFHYVPARTINQIVPVGPPSPIVRLKTRLRVVGKSTRLWQKTRRSLSSPKKSK